MIVDPSLEKYAMDAPKVQLSIPPPAPPGLPVASSNEGATPSATLVPSISNNCLAPSISNDLPAPSSTQPAKKKKQKEEGGGEAVGEETEEKKTKNPNWRIKEDRFLCIAWLNTSKDANVGTGQKASSFWERIHRLFLEMADKHSGDHKNDPKFILFPIRLQGALESRWSLILHRVNKYCGFFANAKRCLGSGKTRDEIGVEAKALFKADMGTSFTLDHCWSILNQSPKWQETMDEMASRTRKEGKKKKIARSQPSSEGCDKATSTSDDDVQVENQAALGTSDGGRPKGRKAAKKRKADDVEIRKGQKELILISRQKLQAIQVVADEAIMSKDTSGMDDLSKRFYEAKKKKLPRVWAFYKRSCSLNNFYLFQIHVFSTSD